MIFFQAKLSNELLIISGQITEILTPVAKIFDVYITMPNKTEMDRFERQISTLLLTFSTYSLILY
jgi:hypothetical protein